MISQKEMWVREDVRAIANRLKNVWLVLSSMSDRLAVLEAGMPYKSEAQRKAMHAAAEGRSTIGIPKSVGRKFVAHAKRSKRKSKR